MTYRDRMLQTINDQIATTNDAQYAKALAQIIAHNTEAKNDAK